MTTVYYKVIIKVLLALREQGKEFYTYEELTEMFEQLFAQCESSVEIKH